MRRLTRSEVAGVTGAISGVSRETVGCQVGGVVGARIAGAPGAIVGCVGGALIANNISTDGSWSGPFGGGPAGWRAWLIRLHTA